MGKKISTFFHFIFVIFYFPPSWTRLGTFLVGLPLSALIVVVLSLLISISQGVGFTSSLSIRFNSEPRPLDKL